MGLCELKVLAIETATEACSAALLINDAVSERYQVVPRQQSELILPMVDDLMSEAGLSANQLDGIAFGRGPGAFTGVRLASAVTQGIAFAADLPVMPVSTLAAMAENIFQNYNTDRVFTAIDARMKEIYWAVFARDQDNVNTIQAEVVVAPESVEYRDHSCGIGVGSGWRSYSDILSEKVESRLVGIQPEIFPRASSIVRLGAKMLQNDGAVKANQAIPLYLRNNVTNRSRGR